MKKYILLLFIFIMSFILFHQNAFADNKIDVYKIYIEYDKGNIVIKDIQEDQVMYLPNNNTAQIDIKNLYKINLKDKNNNLLESIKEDYPIMMFTDDFDNGRGSAKVLEQFSDLIIILVDKNIQKVEVQDKQDKIIASAQLSDFIKVAPATVVQKEKQQNGVLVQVIRIMTTVLFVSAIVLVAAAYLKNRRKLIKQDSNDAATSSTE